MKTNKLTRKRFNKPAHSCIPASGDIRTLFLHITIGDIHQELRLWERLALCNDQSMYETAAAREDLMDFISELLRLTEAFYLLALQAGRTKKKKVRIQQHAAVNNPSKDTVHLLSAPEILHPDSVIRRFCYSFSGSYTATELTDLLDAVITYNGTTAFQRDLVVPVFRRLQWITTRAFEIQKERSDSHLS